jgi:signal transduction histidine kinase
MSTTTSTTSGAARRPGQGWLGLFPPGWPSDVAVAVVVAAIQVVGTVFASEGQVERRALDALAVALLLAGPAALLGRHRQPGVVMFLVTGVTLLYLTLGYPYGPVLLSFVVAVFTAVNEGHRLAAWVSGAALYAGHFGLGYLVGRPPPLTPAVLIGVAAWTLLLLVVAEVVRIRRERMLEAERTHAEEDRRRAGEERLRIARELHDVLAHNISLINVQAGVALHLMDEQPGQSRTALAAIKQASNDALHELRSVLDILRQGTDAPRSPTSGLDSLDGLVANAASAGLAVSTRVEGTPRPLPTGVDLAAFRIVQEALTNVTRHAGQATASVLVAYGDGELTVQVDDDGRGATRQGAEAAGGNGIRGMRERAAALGGQLDAGPRPGGGFRVAARLPLNGAHP